MYRVTYKHRLKSGKDIEDFKNWLKDYWKVQKSWGAQHVRFWRDDIDERNILFCEYQVTDIRNWTEAAIRASSEDIIRDLETISETKDIIVTRVNCPAFMPERTPA